MRRILTAALLLAVALPCAAARAAFPERPARILVGFTAGGTGDFVTRLVAEMVSPRFGQSVVVENRTGAAGMLALEAAARAAPDGYTVAMCPTGGMTVVPEMPGTRLPIDVRTELQPISLVALSSWGMVAGANAPFRSVADVVAAARARPGAVTFGSVGIGSPQHLAGERFALAAGARMLHVPYRGASLAVVDLMALRTDVMITNIGDVVRQVQDGALRLLAVADDAGTPVFPDAPRISDALPGFRVDSWLGICGPRGLPREALDAWVRAIHAGLADPAVQRRLTDHGLRAMPEDPAAFATRIGRDRAMWGEVIRRAGVRAE